MKRLSLLVFFIICVSLSFGISFSPVYLKYFKKRAIDIIDKASPKNECSRHLKAWIGDLFNLKNMWAMHMLDASAKPQTGLLNGNILHWGNYDQCLRISEDKGNDGIIKGQYCSVAVSPVKNVSSDITRILDFPNFLPDIIGIKEGNELKHIIKIFNVLFGLCLPKSCSAENLQKLWDYAEYTFRLPVHLTIDANFCSHEGKVPNKFNIDKYVIWSFGLIIIGICLATAYDMIIYQKLEGSTPGLWEKILVSFSVQKNLKSIFHYPATNTKNSLNCLNGLKVLSMLWVILGHKYIIGYISGTINLLDYFEFRKQLGALVLLLSPFAVDTFLVISGLLLAYKYMEVRKNLPPNTRIPYHMLYILRLLRLWPALIAAIFACASIVKYLNSGPLWDVLMYRMSYTCAGTGWLTAIFLTNMVEFKYQCLEPSWYLAVDTQLFFVAPIFLYFLYKFPRRATLAYIFLSILSCLYAFIVTLDTNVRWTLSDIDEHYHMNVYQSTIVRMPSWIFGLLTGALLYNFQHLYIPKALTRCIWIVIFIIWLGLATVTHIMIKTPYNKYNAGIYNAFASPAWSLAICLLIFLCATGHGGIINQILSFKIYNIIVKFSYSIFLLHVPIIILVGGNKRTATFLNSFTTLHAYFGDLPFIFALSLIWCLAFESPFIHIAKILIQFKWGYSAITANDRKRLLSKPSENNSGIKSTPEIKAFKTKKINNGPQKEHAELNSLKEE